MIGITKQCYALIKKDDGQFLLCGYGQSFTVGYDEKKANSILEMLSGVHRPNILQPAQNELLVCLNLHEKGEKCEYERVL